MTEILLKILQLDSLCNFLSWYERVTVHQAIRDISNAQPVEISEKIIKVYQWIDDNGWEPPKMKYGQDLFQCFYDPDSDQWLTNDYYSKIYPEYQTFKNNIYEK
ncbi:MAG: hypothetical protein JNN23_11095 [Chryseobacterium gambrini]|nr:hypothetical protein [Chryseobacterium gambrini]